ncbi:DUF4190 domain-containing protein [Salininema proteolyticum]|uniref:DUF4190 domain-containing protein n=1 Tax=Salininema proteolyticum TaxID=1607685 RepID=A0ABV8TW69_9ACTN
MTYPPPPGPQHDPYGAYGQPAPQGGQPLPGAYPPPAQPGGQPQPGAYPPAQPGGYAPAAQPGYPPMPGQNPAPMGAYGQPMAVGQAKNGLGRASLILALLGFGLHAALFFAALNSGSEGLAGGVAALGFVALVLYILAIVFGAIGVSRAGKGMATNKGTAVTGMVLGILFLVLPLVIVPMVVSTV